MNPDPDPPARLPIPPRALVAWFFVVLVLYLIAFNLFEYFNHRKGPWVVRFESDASGRPQIVVSQSALQFTNLSIVFPDEKTGGSNLPQQVVFDQPRLPVPF